MEYRCTYMYVYNLFLDRGACNFNFLRDAIERAD